MPGDESIFEKALERQMRKRPVDGIDGAVQGEVCPDAELLAAYHERSLSDEEMVLWKEHIANCGRCQEVLAALETTEEISLGGEREGEFAGVTDALAGMPDKLRAAAAPNAAGKVTPLSRMSPSPAHETMSAPAQVGSSRSKKPSTRNYWVMAAGAIAAAAVLYVGLGTRLHQTPLPTVKILEKANKEEAAKPGAVEKPQLSAQNAAPQELSVERSRSVAPRVAERDQKSAGRVEDHFGAVTSDLPDAGKSGEFRQKLKAPANAGAAAGTRGDSTGQEAGVGAIAGGSLAAAAPRRPETTAKDAEKSAAASARETVVANEAAPAPVPAASQSVEVSSEAKPASAPSEKKDEETKATTITEAVTTAESGESVEVQSKKYRSNATGGALELPKARDSNLIPAPGGNVLWRVGAGGTIEQSTNAGTTWTKQSSGVADKMLRNGSAPSESVCWVVGSEGTILRTVDGGGHWMAVVSPLGPGAKKGELGGVLGVDALHATVWNARNTKQFATSDGGQTWVHVEKRQK